MGCTHVAESISHFDQINPLPGPVDEREVAKDSGRSDAPARDLALQDDVAYSTTLLPLHYNIAPKRF
jgi:hypothetical protein